MTPFDRQALVDRMIVVHHELAEIARTKDGPLDQRLSVTEVALLDELDEIEFELGMDWFDQRIVQCPPRSAG